MPINDVAVIGAGIAGLTSAALLARDGARVALLEAHDKPGGCAGYFEVPSKWGRFCFPTGATVALGLERGGLHAQIFERLGVECPSHPIERLALHLPDRKLDLWHDAARWQSERRRLPGHRAGQELFWRAQERIADAGWFALDRKPSLPLQNLEDLRRNLPLAHPKMAPMLAALPFSMGELMRWLGTDRDRAFVALVNLQLLITTQSLAHGAPLSNGMAGLDLWRHGARQPWGGVGAIARALLEGYEKHGGTAFFGRRVAKLRRRAGCWEIETATGEFFRARRVVANLPRWNLPALLEAAPVPQSEKVRASEKVRGWGAVTLYVALREDAVPSDFPLHAQVLTRYQARPPFFRPGAGDDVFLSLSLPGDETSAPRGWRTLNVSTHVRWEDWQGLSRLEYRAKKRRWRDQLLGAARIALPALDAGRAFVIAATPATWESYTRRAGGSVGGVPLTRRNANLRALPTRTAWPDLVLAGDTTFPGQGTVACALSGFNAWRELGALS